jgi:putative glycosyltransferase
MPQVSIIIPVYNSEKYLRMTIESLLNQTYKDFEIILVDDGSVDASGKLCDDLSLTDRRIVVIHKENGGVSSARNVGIENARGELISFVDHDDYVFSDYLMTMVNEIEEYDLLQSFSLGGPRNTIKTCKRFALDKTKTLRCIKGDNGDVVFPEVDMNNMATIWNQLYKKEVIDKYQLRFRSIQSEDELFSYEYMMYANSIKKIHYQGYFFVSNMDSLGSKHNYIAEYNYIELMENIYSRLISCWEIKDKDYIEKTKIRIANRLVYYVLKGYFVDTKVSKYERLKRWRYAKDDSFTNLKVIPEMSFRENSIYLVAKLGLYGLFDPILNKIIGK